MLHPGKVFEAPVEASPLDAVRLSTQGSLGTRDRSLLSAKATGASDVRKGCNAIKRMSALVAVSISNDVDPVVITHAAEDMTMNVLNRLGFVADDPRLNAWIPMVMDAAATALADAARYGEGRLGGAEMREASDRAADMMLQIMNMPSVERMAERAWPHDIDASTALRITCASAMTGVAVEIGAFSFGHPPEKAVAAATNTVAKSAGRAADALAPSGVTEQVKVMLTQSLINGAATIYAHAWKIESSLAYRALATLGDAEFEQAYADLGQRPLKEVMGRVEARFEAAFGTIVDAVRASFEIGSAPLPPNGATTATSRTSRVRARQP